MTPMGFDQMDEEFQGIFDGGRPKSVGYNPDMEAQLPGFLNRFPQGGVEK